MNRRRNRDAATKEASEVKTSKNSDTAVAVSRKGRLKKCSTHVSCSVLCWMSLKLKSGLQP